MVCSHVLVPAHLAVTSAVARTWGGRGCPLTWHIFAGHQGRSSGPSIEQEGVGVWNQGGTLQAPSQDIEEAQ